MQNDIVMKKEKQMEQERRKRERIENLKTQRIKELVMQLNSADFSNLQKKENRYEKITDCKKYIEKIFLSL